MFGVFFVLKYLFVTSAGFEPATNGAEIRHSIQLNYEAIYLDNRLILFSIFCFYTKSFFTIPEITLPSA